MVQFTKSISTKAVLTNTLKEAAAGRSRVGGCNIANPAAAMKSTPEVVEHQKAVSVEATALLEKQPQSQPGSVRQVTGDVDEISAEADSTSSEAPQSQPGDDIVSSMEDYTSSEAVVEHQKAASVEATALTQKEMMNLFEEWSEILKKNPDTMGNNIQPLLTTLTLQLQGATNTMNDIRKVINENIEAERKRNEEAKRLAQEKREKEEAERQEAARLTQERKNQQVAARLAELKKAEEENKQAGKPSVNEIREKIVKLYKIDEEEKVEVEKEVIKDEIKQFDSAEQNELLNYLEDEQKINVICDWIKHQVNNRDDEEMEAEAKEQMEDIQDADSSYLSWVKKKVKALNETLENEYKFVGELCAEPKFYQDHNGNLHGFDFEKDINQDGDKPFTQQEVFTKILCVIAGDGELKHDNGNNGTKMLDYVRHMDTAFKISYICEWQTVDGWIDMDDGQKLASFCKQFELSIKDGIKRPHYRAVVEYVQRLRESGDEEMYQARQYIHELSNKFRNDDDEFDSEKFKTTLREKLQDIEDEQA